MKRILSAFAAVGSVLLVGCALGTWRTEHTINAHIVIEIRREVEEQADDLLDFLESAEEPARDTADDAPNPSSWLERAIDMAVPIRPVYAAENKELDSPRLTELKEKLRKRHSELEALKEKGCVGENNRAYVEFRETDDALKPEEKNAAQKLVAAENADRKEFYKETAALRKDEGLTVSMVERFHAQRRLERAKPGEIFQLPSAGQDFDDFKASDKGKKLGDECKPGAWVTIK